jgi:host factor-I protein
VPARLSGEGISESSTAGDQGTRPESPSTSPSIDVPAKSPASKRMATMSSEKSQNVQDVFLNYIRKNKTPVTIFLVNGVKLQGIVTWFDNFSLLLRRDGHTQLVYKHAISTVMPAVQVQLFEPDKEVVVEA